MKKPALLTVDDTKHLSTIEISNLFRAHSNPAQYHYLKIIGLHNITIEYAEGMYYYDRYGRKIMDLFGGFGALAVGHNHPRILGVRNRFQEEKRHELSLVFMSQYASALANNLAAISPENLEMVYLGTSGSDVIEASLKLAEKAQGPAKSKIVYATSSFHGKSRGALSVTDSDFYRSTFKLLNNVTKVPFGDCEVLERLFESDPSIGAIVLETIQGGAGIISASNVYWKAVRFLCNKHSVIWIADEVQCGMGRTGRFFAFQHEEFVPDIVVLAKSLGGGKSAIGAMISRRPIYMKAYGTAKSALIHGPSTFSGMGETCCTAIETLHILYDENLIDNSFKMGDFLLTRLKLVKNKYPEVIKEIRGKGLMIGIEFHDISHLLPHLIKKAVSTLDNKLKGTLCGFIGRILLSDYNILVAFTEYNRNVIRIEPPLIINEKEALLFVSALDEICSRGALKIVLNFSKKYFFE